MTTKGRPTKVREITWIQVKYLSVVWIESQREFNEVHAQSIADNFDPDMFGVLFVTRKNAGGVHHLITGQHRAAAIKKLYGENEEVPCIVIDVEDPARAAQIFLAEGTQRKSLSAVQKFQASVTAGYNVEVAVNDIVKRCGYRVSSSYLEKHISAVGSLTGVYNSYGGRVLENSLRLIQATWGMDANAVVGPIIRGYAEFMSEYGDQANWEHLKTSMAKRFTPGKLIGQARTAREIDGGTVGRAISRILVATYGRGNRARPLKGTP